MNKFDGEYINKFQGGKKMNKKEEKMMKKGYLTSDENAIIIEKIIKKATMQNKYMGRRFE